MTKLTSTDHSGGGGGGGGVGRGGISGINKTKQINFPTSLGSLWHFTCESG